MLFFFCSALVDEVVYFIKLFEDTAQEVHLRIVVDNSGISHALGNYYCSELL